MNNVNQELGRASPYDQTVALNDSVVRTLFGVASGAIRMSDGYGKSNVPPYSNVVVRQFNTGTVPLAWTVPAGVTSILIKCWGGGGGALQTSYSYGGGGGFISGYLAVTPGSLIQFSSLYYTHPYAGSTTGTYIANANCSGCPNDPCVGDRGIVVGGPAVRAYCDSISGGNTTYASIIAGGGGGGWSGPGSQNPYGNPGGGGGGTAGGYGVNGATGASGDTPGGSGDNAGNFYGNGQISPGGAPYDGTFQCDDTVPNANGAFGGDGWAGGGGSVNPGGGGGGSAGCSSVFTGVTYFTGGGADYRTPANTSDIDYGLNAGYGAYNGWNGFWQPVGPVHGRIVIRY